MMKRLWIGLTDVYNRFHDPSVREPDVVELRELHNALDRSMMTAYGWTELVEGCAYDFIQDEDDLADEDEESPLDTANGPGVTAGPMSFATKSRPAARPEQEACRRGSIERPSRREGIPQFQGSEEEHVPQDKE